MSDLRDLFRPTTQPAQRIYDAFQDEASKRDGRSVRQWMDCELHRVWEEAKNYAQENDLIPPTSQDVIRAEQSACGHVDYGAKWAYGVARLFTPKSESSQPPA